MGWGWASASWREEASSTVGSLARNSTLRLEEGWEEDQFLWNLEACIARASSSLADRDLRSAMKAGTGNLLSMTRCLNTSDQTQRCLVADENRFDVYERVRDLGPVKFVGAYHSKCEDIFHTNKANYQ